MTTSPASPPAASSDSAFRRFRREKLTAPMFRMARGALPALSDTERDALDAGDVWWDADLFTGNPDWSRLLANEPAKLSPEEQAFLDGPCQQLCAMVDDWQINWTLGDLPEPVWQFLRDNKFFGMIIAKKYGGLGFSALGHSEIIRTLSTRSIALGVTTMVPNSLGPGELLHLFGTEDQREYWLPRLARGQEIPAFALTSEKAGSDASAMTDSGVVCYGQWQGERVLGLRLNWSKRYITLGPVATVLGLAFKMHDPDHLLGDTESIGITAALIPTDLPGVETGRRHIPSGQFFQNGPTTGTDVFIPLDHIIGGPAYAGKGWMMLMSALAAGRGVSLPSLSAAATALGAHTSGAYARVREQFGIPIGLFGGVQRRLGRLAARAYMLDAARKLTCVGLDQGRKLAVISAIMKSNATYCMREAINDAMDVHAGKTVVDGPKNYLGNIYRAIPVAITVEGANILTRNMIIFGQGAIRCHPYVLDEMLALQEQDEKVGLARFDQVLWAHVGHTAKTVLRAWGRAWTGGRFAPAPNAGKATPIYQQMSRLSAAFALTADMALLTLGGSLKRREMLSARMGDVLSELYLVSATLKRWHDEGNRDEDFALLQWTADDSNQKIRRSLDEVLAHLPNRPIAWLLRFITLPGGSNRGPDDELTRECANLLFNPSATRDRIAAGLYHGTKQDSIAQLDQAFAQVIATEPLRKKLREAGQSVELARQSGLLSEREAAQLAASDEAVAAVISVDDFSAAELAQHFGTRPSETVSTL